MALPVGDAASGGLGLRIVSGLVLATLALALAYLGGVAFNLLLLAAAGLMAYEWRRLCDGGAPSARTRLQWSAIGLVYIAVPCIAIIWLRAAFGWQTIFWLFAVVWATDIGAYFAGLGFGGPRLAPRISPHKTWAVLAGGVVCAAAVGAATAVLLGLPHLPRLAFLSALLALVAQAGDLWESMVKRRFQAKDSGTLIPGHGGLLDRLDGLMAAAPAVAAATLIGGESVLAWR